MSQAVRWRGTTLVCRLRIQPRGGRNAFAGQVGDRIKVRIQSPPAEGLANSALLAFLAKQCRVAKSRVRMLAGATSRDKLVEIDAPAVLPDALRAGMRSPRSE
jgi:uncharacterized protein (TIGR00251 family)